MDKETKLPEGFVKMVVISVNKEGRIGISFTKGQKKEVIVNVLANALKDAAMMPNDVVNVPRGILSAGRVRDFMSRHKKKKNNGAFGA